VGAGGRAEGQPQAYRVQRHPHQQDNGRGPDGRPDRRQRGVPPAVKALEGSGALQGVDGEGPPIHGDGAYSSRKNFAAARRAGYRLRAPIKINDSGRSNGTEGWHEETAWQQAGVRGAAARGVDVSRISRKEKAARREDWKEEVGQSVRSRIGHVFSAFKRMFGGHVAARKWENVVKEVARKIAIYNAILEAAGGA